LWNALTPNIRRPKGGEGSYICHKLFRIAIDQGTLGENCLAFEGDGNKILSGAKQHSVPGYAIASDVEIRCEVLRAIALILNLRITPISPVDFTEGPLPLTPSFRGELLRKGCIGFPSSGSIFTLFLVRVFRIGMQTGPFFH